MVLLLRGRQSQLIQEDAHACLHRRHVQSSTDKGWEGPVRH